VDVTACPDILTRKEIRSVPVIEVGDQRIVGYATSEQIANLIVGSRVVAA
jgi:predicted transcriptional regulator